MKNLEERDEKPPKMRQQKQNAALIGASIVSIIVFGFLAVCCIGLFVVVGRNFFVRLLFKKVMTYEPPPETGQKKK